MQDWQSETEFTKVINSGAKGYELLKQIGIGGKHPSANEEIKKQKVGIFSSNIYF